MSRRGQHGRGAEDMERGDGLRVVQGRRRKHHPVWRVLLRVLLAGCVIAAGSYVWRHWGSLAPESAVDWINAKLTGGQAGDGFPVELTGSGVTGMEQTSEGLALLGDSALVVYNPRGGEVLRRQHGLSSPILRTAGRWILMADAGGTRLRLDTRSSEGKEITVDGEIVGASVSENGHYAVATGSNLIHTSELAAYNRQQELLYRWQASEKTMLDVALSRDGNSMVSVGVAASGGFMKSYVLFFDFDKSEPVAQYEDGDNMLFSARYFSGGTAAAIGDRALWVVNRKGSIREKYSYDDHEMLGYAVGEGAVSVALRGYGGGEGGTVLTVNSSGAKAYETTFEGTFRCMTPYRSGVAVLTTAHLYVIDAGGKAAVYEPVRDGRMMSAFGGSLMVLGLTSLSEADLSAVS